MILTILNLVIPLGIAGTTAAVTMTIMRNELANRKLENLEKQGISTAEKLNNFNKDRIKEMSLSDTLLNDEISHCREILKEAEINLHKGRRVNRLHTIDDYSNKLRYKFSRKLSSLKNTALKKSKDEIEISETTMPDWIRMFNLPDGSQMMDKRTFIQCSDYDTAQEFKSYFDNNYNTNKYSPFVGEFQFNDSGSKKLKPFRVSCPDRMVYEKGLLLLTNLIQQTNNELNSLDIQTFPITVRELRDFNSNQLVTKLYDIEDVFYFSEELSNSLRQLECEQYFSTGNKEDGNKFVNVRDVVKEGDKNIDREPEIIDYM